MMFPMHILTYNTRGLNASSKRDLVKAILNEFKAELVVLLETKQDDIDAKNFWEGV